MRSRLVAIIYCAPADTGERDARHAHDVADGFQILVAVVISALVFAIDGLLARLARRVFLQIAARPSDGGRRWESNPVYQPVGRVAFSWRRLLPGG